MGTKANWGGGGAGLQGQAWVSTGTEERSVQVRPRVLARVGWCPRPGHLPSLFQAAWSILEAASRPCPLHPNPASVLGNIRQNVTLGDSPLPPRAHTGPDPGLGLPGAGQGPKAPVCQLLLSGCRPARKGVGSFTARDLPGAQSWSRPLPGRPRRLLRNVTVTNGLLRTCHLSSGAQAQPPGPAVHCQLDGGQAPGVSACRHLDTGAGTHRSGPRPSNYRAHKGPHAGTYI